MNVTAVGSSAGAQAAAPARQGQALTPEQLSQIQALRATDQKVRAHEAAHVGAGGGVVTGGPSYTYTYGPDGRAYAVGGEVGVDTSRAGDPQATIEKAQRIQAAALAPADPSPQDLRVAARARALETQARLELVQQQREQQLEQKVERQYGTAGAVAPGNAGLSAWA